MVACRYKIPLYNLNTEAPHVFSSNFHAFGHVAQCPISLFLHSPSRASPAPQLRMRTWRRSHNPPHWLHRSRLTAASRRRCEMKAKHDLAREKHSSAIGQSAAIPVASRKAGARCQEATEALCEVRRAVLPAHSFICPPETQLSSFLLIQSG